MLESIEKMISGRSTGGIVLILVVAIPFVLIVFLPDVAAEMYRDVKSSFSAWRQGVAPQASTPRPQPPEPVPPTVPDQVSAPPAKPSPPATVDTKVVVDTPVPVDKPISRTRQFPQPIAPDSVRTSAPPGCSPLVFPFDGPIDLQIGTRLCDREGQIAATVVEIESEVVLFRRTADGEIARCLVGRDRQCQVWFGSPRGRVSVMSEVPPAARLSPL